MKFREDVEGLRGLAVLLVVAFHVGIAGAAGGYIGVDVFFVISGFLITSQLVERVERDGCIGLVDFWARRLRRLVPLLTLTVVVTLLAGFLVYSPLVWSELSRDGASSMLYVSNVQFARDSTFYFRRATSPLLHTWSLSVEEQFYVGWPILVGLAAMVAGRVRGAVGRWVLGMVVAVSVASLVVGALLTRRGSPWAFYSSPTRAWEFGAGAVALFACRRPLLARSAVRVAVGWAGLLALFGSVAALDQFSDVPVPAAVIPVVGSAMLLCAGAGPGDVEGLARPAPGRLLAARPLRALGRISYAWYLFHWPAIVLLSAWMQRTSVAAAVLAALGSLVAALAATRFVEVPIRRSRRLARPRTALVAAGLAVAVVLAGAGLLRLRATHELARPTLARLAETRAGRSETGSAACEEQPLASGRSVCVFGNPLAATTVLVVGDSHAAQWMPALELVASRLDVRLIARTRGGCPAFDVYVARSGDDEASTACLDFRAESGALLEELRPDLVVLANADYTGRLLSSPTGDLLGREDALAAWGTAASRFAQAVLPLGSAIIVIENNPSQERDPIECLARNRSAAECSVTAGRALPPLEELADVEVTSLSAVTQVDVLHTAPLICDDLRCLVERDGVIVYADQDHLSVSFVELHADDVQRWIEAALARAGAAT